MALLTNEQKELIQEIGNGILEIAGLDKLVKIGGTLKKIRDLSKSEKNGLKNQIIQQILTVDNVDEAVLRTAVEALKKEITSENMLRYRGKESELLNVICEKNKFSLFANRMAFRKLMEKILHFCSQNAVEIISHEALGLATYVAVQDNGDMLRDANDKLSGISDKLDQMAAAPASSTETKEESLKHNNSTYKTKFTQPFFLEKEMPEKKFCSLRNVFVEPVLMEDKVSGLEEKLRNWSVKYDEKSGEWNDAMNHVFLLYGKAGVGKSSYTAKIIYKNLFGKNWLALELRSCADKLKSGSAWESVKAVFGTLDDDAYKDSILILDGLDEVCVLYPDFDGKVFIENLQIENALRTNNIKILITSREGYFGGITQKSNLLTDTIQWTEEQVREWCKAYCTVHPSRSAWVEKFMTDYRNLPKKDNRRAIFCIPIILYLCCVREIDIGNERSVVAIYEKAFRTVGEHEHNPTSDRKMQENDKQTFAVNWQYTKELAFRIFLDGKSPTVLGNDGIKNAKEHTKERFADCEPVLDRYFALFPFASEKKGEGKPEGMEFAHKTVTDYFTAVKLYEDYFEKMFEKADPVKTLWEGLWRAFRYKEIPTDIMRYLAQVIQNRQGENFNTYRMKFFDCYYEGVKAQTIWQLLDVPEYTCEMAYDLLPQQVGLVFRNLTYLLEFLQYAKDEIEPKIVYTVGLSSFFQRGVRMDVYCLKWKGLRNADLHGANLRAALLNKTDLRYANLHGADLGGAFLNATDLRNADLNGADLCGADLSGADLSGADLRGAKLYNADLRNTNLRGADLRGADLRSVTWSENQDLRRIRLWDTDFPKLDKAIEIYRIRLMHPVVYKFATDERLKYDPETNRAEEP